MQIAARMIGKIVVRPWAATEDAGRDLEALDVPPRDGGDGVTRARWRVGAMTSAPLVIHDRYEVLEVLGEGTFARTVRARDREAGAEVAIKVMHPSRMASLGDFARFEREAEALRTLAHVAIPRYLDHFAWRHEGERVYCLVQTYRRGTPLSARIAQKDRMDAAEVVELGAALLEILAYLASREPPMVHRDVKPSNVILDETGAPALVDFGAVREAVRETIHTGSTVVGTFGFMPPEQLIGQATPATDIFAVGVTMLCTLTRRAASSLSSDGFTVDLDALSLNVSPDLKAVLATMIAPRLEERYGDPALALADLRAIQAGEAPRHVEARIRLVAQRERAEQREIQRRLNRGVSRVYRLLVALLVAAVAGVGVATVALLQRDDVDAGLVALGGISLVGLVASFRGIAVGYNRRFWEPPPASWIDVIARVDGHTERRTQEGHTYLVAELGFRVGERVRRVTQSGGEASIQRDLPVGSRHRLLVSPRDDTQWVRELSPVDTPLPPRRSR